jgi:hypothetical protein
MCGMELLGRRLCSVTPLLCLIIVMILNFEEFVGCHLSSCIGGHADRLLDRNAMDGSQRGKEGIKIPHLLVLGEVTLSKYVHDWGVFTTGLTHSSGNRRRQGRKCKMRVTYDFGADASSSSHCIQT